MVRLELEEGVAARLDAFLRADTSAARTDHWQHYGPLNRVTVEGRHAVVHAVAGFDSEYDLNFRPMTPKERIGSWWHAIHGRNDPARMRGAYTQLWGERPGATHSSAAIGAEHYFRFLPPAKHYLEIGAGTGYLAALAHEAWGAAVTIIDLPEIVPLSFLYLHVRFPAATFALPNETGDATFRFLTQGDSIAGHSIDLGVNTVSFQEMSPAKIAEYFALLRRVLKPGGHFFTCNRAEKVMDGVPVRFADYPWRDDDADILFERSRLHEMLLPEHPFLMRLCRLAPR